MRQIVGIATLLITLGIGQVAEADLIVDVTGIPGGGQSIWTFSGSYMVGDVSQTLNAYSLFGDRFDDNNINNFTHDSGELNGGDISVADNTFNLEFFGLLSSTAQIVGSASGAHALDGIFLDSDTGTPGDDDLIWYADGAFQDFETLTFNGAATIALDINLFLAPGEGFRSVNSLAVTAGNPADFTMNLGAAPVPEPSSLILLGTGMLGLLTRARRRHSN